MCPTSRNSVHGFCRQTASDGPSRLDQAFATLDTDGDGVIKSSDLLFFFTSCLGQSFAQEEAEAMISMADLDGNSAIDLEEFKRLMTDGTAPSPPFTDPPESKAMREMYQVLDMNHDGLLSAEDLKAAMVLAGETVCNEELDAMIVAAGGAREAPIDFDCFSRLMTDQG